MIWLIVATLSQGDTPPGKVLSAIEERLEKAKTVKVSSSLEITVTDEAGTSTSDRLTGSLMVRQMDKMVFTVKSEPPDPDRTLYLHWEELRVTENSSRGTTFGVHPSNLKKILLQACVRGGSAGAIGLLGEGVNFKSRPRDSYNYPLPAASEEERLEPTLSTTDVQAAPDVEGLKAITYKTVLYGSNDSCRVTLLYDAKTLKPKKRTLKWKRGDLSTVVVETYSEFETDVEIPNLAFWEAFGCSAEEITFRKIEESILAAKTLRVNVSSDATLRWDKTELKCHFKGELLLAEGHRIHLSGLMTQDGKETKGSLISDGKKLAQRPESEGEPKLSPKTMDNFIRTAVARSGILGGQLIAGLAMAFETDRERDFREFFSVGGFENGDDEKGMKTLTYTLRMSGDNGQVKIWYDPKSLKLLKRTLSFKGGGPGSEFTETYEDFTVNTDISEDKFKLPAEK